MTILYKPTRRSFLMSGAAFGASLAMPAIFRASSRSVFTHSVRSRDGDGTGSDENAFSGNG